MKNKAVDNKELSKMIKEEYQLQNIDCPLIYFTSDEFFLKINNVDKFHEIIYNISEHMGIYHIISKEFNIKLKYKKSYEKRT